MPNVVPISEARSKLPKLVELADSVMRRTLITVKGKTKAVLMSASELEGLEATLEILSDPEVMKAIKRGEKDVKAGRIISWEDLKKELDW